MTAKDLDYWYPWSPAKFKRDTMHLNDEQELIYRRIIDFYMEVSKGPIEDNDQTLANIARFPIDRFSPHAAVIRKFFKLCNKNKNPSGTGYLMLTRCEAILADQVERREKKRGAGSLGGKAKANKNKGNVAKAKQNDATIQDNTDKVDTNVSTSRRAQTPPSDVVKAFTMYNETAERCGIPKAQRLNKAREARLAARIRDAGGLEGWGAAMAKIEGSDFCTGRKTDFKATLDFILQDSSFTKLMEGNYDNGPRHSSTKNTNGIGGNELDGFSRAAAKIAGNDRRNVQAGPDAAGDLFAERPRPRSNTPD